jgi:hypothetical protein
MRLLIVGDQRTNTAKVEVLVDRTRHELIGSQVLDQALETLKLSGSVDAVLLTGGASEPVTQDHVDALREVAPTLGIIVVSDQSAEAPDSSVAILRQPFAKSELDAALAESVSIAPACGDEFSAVRLDPASYFRSPGALADDPRLSFAEKLELLEEWRIDREATLRAAEEGMDITAEAAPETVLPAIVQAIERLHEQDASAAPTPSLTAGLWSRLH